MSKSDKFKQDDRTLQALEQQPQENSMQLADRAIFAGDSSIDWNAVTQQAQTNAVKSASGEIIIGGFTLTQKGTIWNHDNQPTKDNWQQALLLSFRMESGIQWIIGDLIAFGEAVGYGDTPEIAEAFGKKPQTLYNYASVCRSFDEISRRRENLSFGHHEAVAAVKSKRASDKLLNQAVDQEWSVAQLRRAVHGKTKQQADEPDKETLKIQRKRMTTIGNFIGRARSGELDTTEREKALGEIAAARRWLDEAENELSHNE